VPVHSLATLLSDLGTICLNTIAPADPTLPGFRFVTTPTALQRQALELLGVSHRSGSRSQQPSPRITKAQVNGPTRESLGGTTG
jgi:hypothetical protein